MENEEVQNTGIEEKNQIKNYKKEGVKENMSEEADVQCLDDCVCDSVEFCCQVIVPDGFERTEEVEDNAMAAPGVICVECDPGDQC